MENQIQDLKNKLNETTFMKSIDALLMNPKIEHNIKIFLIGMKRTKRLYDLNFGKDSKYIEILYSLTILISEKTKKFQTYLMA